MEKIPSFRATFTGIQKPISGNDIRNKKKDESSSQYSIVLSRETSKIMSQTLKKENMNFEPMHKTANFYKILEKRDIIEEILYREYLGDAETFRIILALYGNLHKQQYVTQSLIKLIISFERVELFDMIVFHIADILEDIDEMSDDEIREEDQEGTKDTMNKKDHNYDGVYDYDEIVSDAFSYSIAINKLHITFYLFKMYKRNVFGNSRYCTSSIINSLRVESVTSNKVYFLEERLFIISKLMRFMDHKLTFDFLDFLNQIVKSPPENNMFVYMTNSVKIIAKLLYIMNYLVQIHPSLKFKAKKVSSTLCNVANHILHKNSDLREVEDILKDQLYSGTRVLDLIANNDIIEILNNPLLDSVVSNIYVGSYQRNSIMTKSLAYSIIQKEFNFDPDDEVNQNNSTLVLVKPRKKKVRERKRPCCKTFCQRIFQGYRHPRFDTHGINYIVGHQFMYKIWSKSPNTQHLFETLIILLIGILMVYYSNQLVDSGEEADAQNLVVTNIENGTNSGNLTAEYATLETITTSYLEETMALLILNTLSIGYFIKDIQELMY